VRSIAGRCFSRYCRMKSRMARWLHLHALAEREAADLDVELVAHVEHLGEVVEGLPVARVGNAVDLLEQEETVGGGQVPPELRLLTHDEGDRTAEAVVALPWVVAEHARPARRRLDDAGQHLDYGGLAGAVGPHETHDLGLVHAERDLPHGVLGDSLPPEQRPHRAEQPRGLLVDVKRLGESLDFDHRRAVGSTSRIVP
jgi:hypothetical protein